MKGVSPVIATILLLLITVAIVGIAFSFFSRVTSTATTEAQAQTETQIQNLKKTISIDAINSTQVTIRSTSTISIQDFEIKVYRSGSAQTCTPALPANLTAASTFSCSWGGTCVPGEEVKVVTPGISVTDNCP